MGLHQAYYYGVPAMNDSPKSAKDTVGKIFDLAGTMLPIEEHLRSGRFRKVVGGRKAMYVFMDHEVADLLWAVRKVDWSKR